MPPYIEQETGFKVGYWGRPTSTLDWCEENYAILHYVAELWNTASNLAMILPGLLGVWFCIKSKLELRYTLCFAFLACVGVGSSLFHGSLLYWMQMLDELPMLILSALILFPLYEMGVSPGVRTCRTYVISSVLAVYTAFVSLIYIFVNDPTFHEVAYGIMVFAICVQTFHCLRTYNSWKYLYFGLTSFALYLFAFILWNIDNMMCPHLRLLRKEMPYLAHGITQFHAWWHLFAGLGTYFQILLSCRIRLEHLKRPCALQFFAGIPYLKVTEKND